jgi:hypothetical protein
VSCENFSYWRKKDSVFNPVHLLSGEPSSTLFPDGATQNMTSTHRSNETEEEEKPKVKEVDPDTIEVSDDEDGDEDETILSTSV